MEEFIFAINGWIQGSFGLAWASCLLWGLVSVLLCPCHLAAIPLIMGYVGGQSRTVGGREATFYALVFSLGLIITITAIGVICVILGRMLGDVSPYWGVPVGLIIILLGLSLTGALSVHAPVQKLERVALRGAFGALVLGLLYGLLSGACTFGFMAPILALGSGAGFSLRSALLVFAFAIGHCLPLVLAGLGASFMQKVFHSSGMQRASLVGRVLAGVLVVGVGAYIMTTPFFD